MRFFSCAFLFLASAMAAPAFATVVVTSPSNGQTVSPKVQFVASATSTCPNGVASMGVYVDNTLYFHSNGITLNTTLTLPLGAHKVVVQEWDFCGGATATVMNLTVMNQTVVSVTSPASGSTVDSLVNFVANATSSCASGVASMGIYVNNQLAYVTQGASLNIQLVLSTGSQNTVVQEWDYCGGSANTPIQLNVSSGKTLYNLQSSWGWKSSGQLAPYYSDCVPSCPGVTWSMWQDIANPSLSGSAAVFNLGGTTPYSDVLFYNQLIGDSSTQNLPDNDQTLVPALHNFTYDAYFYLADAAHTQAVEFDINWFMNTIGMTWGTECRVEGGNQWDIWDNVHGKWVPTGFACNPLVNAWNHVTVIAQRSANNSLIYKSITLNGVTANINQTYAPFTVPPSWFGITVNYQMDGDHNQAPITTYLDKLNFTYE
jgi:Bacterial Ig domain